MIASASSEDLEKNIASVYCSSVSRCAFYKSLLFNAPRFTTTAVPPWVLFEYFMFDILEVSIVISEAVKYFKVIKCILRGWVYASDKYVYKMH